MKREQKQLIKILDVCGQLNLVIIVVLPNFFDLNKSIALRRSKFLLHVYTDDKLNRGRFAYFGEKRKSRLYFYGKKKFDSYMGANAEFTGLFDDYKPKFYQEYKEKVKNRSLQEVLALKEFSKRDVHIEICCKFKEKLGLSTKQLADGFGYSERTIQKYIKEGKNTLLYPQNPTEQPKI